MLLLKSSFSYWQINQTCLLTLNITIYSKPNLLLNKLSKLTRRKKIKSQQKRLLLRLSWLLSITLFQEMNLLFNLSISQQSMASDINLRMVLMVFCLMIQRKSCWIPACFTSTTTRDHTPQMKIKENRILYSITLNQSTRKSFYSSTLKAT